jgi:hypothetical protein
MALTFSLKERLVEVRRQPDPHVLRRRPVPRHRSAHRPAHQPDTAKAITLDLTGVVSEVSTADGGSVLRAVGTTAFVFYPGDAGPGDNRIGRFYLFTGYFVVVSDADCVVTSFRSYGTRKDVCAMLS